MIESQPQRSLRDFFCILFQHKGKVVLFFLGVWNLALGVRSGILGGIGLAITFEHFDHSLNPRGDFEENFKAQVLASYPLMKREK